MNKGFELPDTWQFAWAVFLSVIAIGALIHLIGICIILNTNPLKIIKKWKNTLK